MGMNMLKISAILGLFSFTGERYISIDEKAWAERGEYSLSA
jgi:hypothetical protein